MPASEESTRRAVSLRHATSRRTTLSVFIAAPRSGRDPLCSPGTLQRGCPRQVADPRALPTAASVTGRQRAWRPLSPRRQRSSSSSEDPPGTRRGEVQLEGECEPLDRGAGCSEREALAGWVPWSDSGRQIAVLAVVRGGCRAVQAVTRLRKPVEPAERGWTDSRARRRSGIPTPLCAPRGRRAATCEGWPGSSPGSPERRSEGQRRSTRAPDPPACSFRARSSGRGLAPR